MKLGRREASARFNLQIALWFGICIVLLVFLSLIFRFAFIARDSKFDGKHRFTIDVFSIKTKEHSVISIEPLSSSASILQVSGAESLNIGRILKFPVDGHITQNRQGNSQKLFRDKEISGSDIAFVLVDSIINSRKMSSDLTIIDLFRLVISFFNLSSANIKVLSLVLPIADYETDKLLSSFFIDTTVSLENVSVQIVNGTEISGLGNRLARVISNSGGNIVSVITSTSPIKHSQINYIGKKTYTAKRLSRLLSFPLFSLDTQLITPTPIQDVLIPTPVIPSETIQKPFSDIIIVIGEESSSSSAF